MDEWSAREGQGAVGRGPTMVQERWLKKSWIGRFWSSFWPTLCCLALVVLAGVVLWSSAPNLLVFVVVLYVLMFAVPGGLVAAVVAAGVLAARGSARGFGIVAMVAVSGAFLALVLSLTANWH